MSFKVGDKVRIVAIRHDGDSANPLTIGDITTVIEIESPSYGADLKTKVELPSGRQVWMYDEEIEPVADAVAHPSHYTSHPGGIECLDVVKHMNFCLGNVVKYVWRADLKGNAIEDLEKAAEYLRIEIERRKNASHE